MQGMKIKQRVAFILGFFIIVAIILFGYFAMGYNRIFPNNNIFGHDRVSDGQFKEYILSRRLW